MFQREFSLTPFFPCRIWFRMDWYRCLNPIIPLKTLSVHSNVEQNLAQYVFFLCNWLFVCKATATTCQFKHHQNIHQCDLFVQSRLLLLLDVSRLGSIKLNETQCKLSNMLCLDSYLHLNPHAIDRKKAQNWKKIIYNHVFPPFISRQWKCHKSFPLLSPFFHCSLSIWWYVVVCVVLL